MASLYTLFDSVEAAETEARTMMVERFAELHPYDTPAIVTWAAKTAPDDAARLLVEAHQ